MRKRVARLVLLSVIAVMLFIAGFLVLNPTAGRLPPSATIHSLNLDRDRPSFFKRTLLKLRAFFIKAESIRFRADIFTAPDIDGVALGKLFGRAAAAEHQGTKLWFLSTNDIVKLEDYVKSLDQKEDIASPAIVTSEYGTGSMFVGATATLGTSNVPVGLEVSFSPRLKDGRIGASLDFVWTELATNQLRTNAAFSAEIDVPQGTRILILSEQSVTKRPMCVFIGATRPNWNSHYSATMR